MSRAGILRGEAAALSSCRVLQDTAALEQILAGEDLLYGPVAVTALFPARDDAVDDGDSANHRVPGTLVIASKHLLFWADSSSTDVRAASASDYDLRVDALSIDLHALTGVDNMNNTQEEGDNDGDEEERERGPSAVYIQMSGEQDHHDEDEDDENGNDSSLFELTVQPTASQQQQGDDDNAENGGPTDVERISRQLFEAIGKMISLNPIDPNDQDELPENDGGALFGGGGSWITGEGFSGNDVMESDMTPAQLREWETHNDDDDDGDDELMFAAAASDAPPTEEERDAMLERLDNLLIVPPEFEVHDDDNDDASTGQFDDADEEDDDDADLL